MNKATMSMSQTDCDTNALGMWCIPLQQSPFPVAGLPHPAPGPVSPLDPQTGCCANDQSAVPAEVKHASTHCSCRQIHLKQAEASERWLWNHPRFLDSDWVQADNLCRGIILLHYRCGCSVRLAWLVTAPALCRQSVIVCTVLFN